jgi:2'-5' RNA ligase
MRLFIAIDFNKEIKKKLVDLQANLKDMAVSGRWKYIDNLHLTLKFLGETKPENR